jgi:choline-sulfatase
MASIAVATSLWLALAWRKPPQPPNVLLVTIDTLRWDHLGCYGDAHAVTPALDALAARGVRFETAIAHVPLTAPSHASILTGLTPLRHGVRDNGAYVLPSTVQTLATRLGRAGYATAGFVSGFPLDHRFGFASGFDLYDDRLAQEAGHAAYTERPADATTANAIAWLDRARAADQPAGDDGATRRPWFVWVHYFDPHAPYAPPGEFARRFADRPYDGEIAFVDTELARLLEHATAGPQGLNTLVLVTADHGESFGEHGEDTHGVFVYDATLRVPFLIAGPGINTGRTSPVVARSIDIVPTLMDLAGLTVPTDVDGRSLRATLEGRAMPDEPAYVESLLASRHLGWAPLHGLRSAGWKYIRAPRAEIYDLTADPAEQKNQFGNRRSEAAGLETRLESAMHVAQTPVVQARTTERELNQLRALGYLSGSAEPSTSAVTRDPKDGIALITTLERGVADVSVNPARAITTLEAVLRDDPDAVLAHRYLAFAHVALAQHDAAIAELTWLQRRGQASADDLLLLAETQRALGHAAEGRSLVEAAARLDPRSPEPPLTEARAAMASQQFGEAEAAYQRALAVAPDHPEALRGLGEIALARGDLAGATGFFERAHARDPEDGLATLRLAVAYARGGQTPAAVPLFQTAVQQLPGNGEALAGLAAALARSGRALEAVPYFERAVASGLRTPPVLNGLGFARLEAGDQPGALSALRESLQLRPDQPQVAQAVQRLSQGDAAR